ncbi:MAG: hypothetical protein JSV12_00945 [Candidatus Bathyarchaeota archaeon]|nr:MAG: hypothetical protein JSV12_00945 [Candidatus Bathyarchaeota archaeon]
MQKKLGHRCSIKIKHYGCWASELSLFLSQKKLRPDLELFVFVLTKEVEWYKVLLVVRSRERKEISTELEYAIKNFLFEHHIIRAFKPNLPRPYPHKLIFLICIQDTDVPGAIRIVERLGCWFEPTIGMHVKNGIEDVAFFTDDSSLVGRALEEYSKNIGFYEVYSSKIGPVYKGLADLVNDPHHLIRVLVEGSRRQNIIVARIVDKTKELLNEIHKHAKWLVPLFKEILKWTGKEFIPYIE